MIKSETITNLASALVKAQSEMGNATKGAANPFFKSRYADLNAIREACMPVLARHGLSVVQPTVTIDGKKFVETLILHESGEYMGGHTEILAIKETDAQAQGSGISYARRYGLQSLLCIGAEDDDGESAIGRSKTPEKKSLVSQNNGIRTESEVKPQNTAVNPDSQRITGVSAVNPESQKVQGDSIQGSETPKKGFGVKKEAPKTETNDGWN